MAVAAAVQAAQLTMTTHCAEQYLFQLEACRARFSADHIPGMIRMIELYLSPAGRTHRRSVVPADRGAGPGGAHAMHQRCQKWSWLQPRPAPSLPYTDSLDRHLLPVVPVYPRVLDCVLLPCAWPSSTARAEYSEYPTEYLARRVRLRVARCDHADRSPRRREILQLLSII